MGLFARLFRAPCAHCGRSAHLVPTTFPDQSRARLCPDCRREMDEIFAEPLHDFQFGDMVDELSISRETAWGVEWGATRTEILAQILPEHRPAFEESRSASLLGSRNVLLAGHKATLYMTLNEAGEFYDLSMHPKKAVLDAIRPLEDRIGGAQRAPSLVSNERRFVWFYDELEWELTFSTTFIASLRVTTERRWTLPGVLDSLPGDEDWNPAAVG